MPEFSSSETALRWVVQYSIHSLVLAAIAALVARAWLQPGARLGVVLRVAMFGALVSASLPWKLTPPIAGFTGALSSSLTAAPVAGTGAPGNIELERMSLSLRGTGEEVAGATAPGAGQAATANSAASWILQGALGVFLILAGVSLTRLVRQRRRFVLALDRSPHPDASAAALLDRWAGDERRARIVLSGSSRLAVPVVLSSREICLPTNSWDTLAKDEQAALLAHEYAHVVRRDPFWFAASVAIERVFFFLPWQRMVRARFVASAETACDAAAAGRVGSRAAVARCLAAVAQWSVDRDGAAGVPSSIPALVARRSELVERVRRVLDSDAEHVSRRFGWATAALFVVFACGAPNVATPTEEPAVPEPVRGLIEIHIDMAGGARASRSADFPPLEDLVFNLNGRAGKEALGEWLAEAAADLPAVDWGALGLVEGASLGPLNVKAGPLLIVADARSPMKYVQFVMGQCGRQGIQIADIRLRRTSGEGGVYAVPLPVDSDVLTTPSPETPTYLIRVRLDVTAAGTLAYSVELVEGAAGIGVAPEEEIEEPDGADAARPEPIRTHYPTIGEFEAGLGTLRKGHQIVGATIDPRKGTTVADVTALLDVLVAQGVDHFNFLGSYER